MALAAAKDSHKLGLFRSLSLVIGQGSADGAQIQQGEWRQSSESHA